MIEVLRIIFDNPFSFFGTVILLAVVFEGLSGFKPFSINHYHNKPEEKEEP